MSGKNGERSMDTAPVDMPVRECSSDADVRFLEEAARYFERRPTGGEDAAFWSNVANASNCRRIARRLHAAGLPNA